MTETGLLVAVDFGVVLISSVSQTNDSSPVLASSISLVSSEEESSSLITEGEPEITKGHIHVSQYHSYIVFTYCSI